MKILSVRKIEEAVLRGDFVYIGNRQKVLGAATFTGINGPAQPGHAWLDVANKEEWVHAKLTDVVIEKRKETDDMKGKRGPRPGIRSSKKGAQVNAKQNDLPGVDVDSRKIQEIEDAQEAVNDASAALTRAHEDLEEGAQWC